MPYIRFTGFETGWLRELAPVLVDRFSDIANSPKEVIKIERAAVEPILNSPQSVEIRMFQRDQAVHDEIAMMIHTLLAERGCPHAHIYFNLLSPALYYKGGIAVREIPRRTTNVT